MTEKEAAKVLQDYSDGHMILKEDYTEASKLAIKTLEEIEKFRHSMLIIGETCVEESKWHMSAEDAVKKIRENIYWSRSPL